MAKTQSRPVTDTGDTGLASEDLELLDQEADLARSQQEADVVRRRKKQEAVRAVLAAGGKSPLSMRNQGQSSRTVTRPEPSEFAKEQEPEEQEQRAARRANPRSEALRRRFEAGTELEAAQAVSDANPNLGSAGIALKAAEIKAEDAKGRFLGGDETRKYGRFGTPTPPPGDTVTSMSGPDFSGLAAMEEELADRGAWLESGVVGTDEDATLQRAKQKAREAGEPAPDPVYRARLARREYDDLKRQVDQKRREIAVFRIQDAGLRADYSPAEEESVVSTQVPDSTQPEAKPAPAPAPVAVAAPTPAPPVFLQPEDYNLEDFGYSLE